MQGEIMVNDDTVFESLMKMDSAIAKLTLYAEYFGRDDYEWKGTEYDELIDELVILREVRETLAQFNV